MIFASGVSGVNTHDVWRAFKSDFNHQAQRCKREDNERWSTNKRKRKEEDNDNPTTTGGSAIQKYKVQPATSSNSKYINTQYHTSTVYPLVFHPLLTFL